MKRKKQRKNSDPETINEELVAETDPDDENAAAAEKEKREKKRRQLINRNTRKYIVVSSVLSAMGLYFGFYFFPQMFFIIFSNDALQNSGTLKLLCSIMGFFVYFFYLVNHYLRKRKKLPETETVKDMLQFYPRSISPKSALLCAAGSNPLSVRMIA